MSFLKKESKGFNEGEPTDIKADMKNGRFAYLGEKKGFKGLTVHMLKDVSLSEVCLFPHKEQKKVYDWINIFFINLETSEVCSMLVKTYCHGQFKKYQRELTILNNADSGQTIDYTTVETRMEIVEFERKGESGYKIEFYCCKDKKGNWVKGIKEDGSVIEDATVQILDQELYKKGEGFYKKHHEDLYNSRVVKEMAEQNFDQYKEMPPQTQKEFRLFLLYKNGYISEDKAKQLAAEAKGQMPENLLA